MHAPETQIIHAVGPDSRIQCIETSWFQLLPLQSSIGKDTDRCFRGQASTSVCSCTREEIRMKWIAIVKPTYTYWIRKMSRADKSKKPYIWPLDLNVLDLSPILDAHTTTTLRHTPPHHRHIAGREIRNCHNGQLPKIFNFWGGVVGEVSVPISRGGSRWWSSINSRGGSWRGFPFRFRGGVVFEGGGG